MVGFSSRISWSLEPSRLASAIESRRGRLLDLTQSNPTDAGLRYQDEEILAAIADPRALRYDPAPAGLRAAREAVSSYYEGAIEPDHVLLTASTSEAYSYIFKLLCDPGDRVLVPRPSYPLFEFLAHLEGVEVAQYPMHYHGGWYIDLDELQRSVTARTRVIVFVNPNNPTGSYLKQSEFSAVAEICRRRGIALVTDEVFKDFKFASQPELVDSIAGCDDVLSFVLSGLSKVAGLPQLKLGWIVVNGPERDRTEALKRLELIADTFLSAGAPVQHALPRLLELRHDVQRQIQQRTRANRDLLFDLARESPAQMLQADGGWYATLQMPRVRSEEEWVLWLAEDHDTLVQPGYFYDFECEAYLILSLLTAPEIFNEGARRTILASKC